MREKRAAVAGDTGWVVVVRLAKGGFLLSEWGMVESERDPLAVEKSTTQMMSCFALI